jgi:flagellar biosynthesis/type III secretory pathway protein FliH
MYQADADFYEIIATLPADKRTFIMSRVDAAYDAGFEDGSNSMGNERNIGFDEGYQNGIEDGYATGFDDGYRSGAAEDS